MESRASRYQVLFVCMGNICRSPAAEGVFRQRVEESGLADQISCDSAGTIDFHRGQAPDPRVRATGKERGFEITGRARQVSRSDLGRFDLVLVMDHDNLDDVRALDETGQYQEKVQLFCDYVTESSEREVPDPYYGGQAGFEKVFDLLEDGAEQLLNSIQEGLDRKDA